MLTSKVEDSLSPHSLVSQDPLPSPSLLFYFPLYFFFLPAAAAADVGMNTKFFFVKRLNSVPFSFLFFLSQHLEQRLPHTRRAALSIWDDVGANLNSQDTAARICECVCPKFPHFHLQQSVRLVEHHCSKKIAVDKKCRKISSFLLLMVMMLTRVVVVHKLFVSFSSSPFFSVSYLMQIGRERLSKKSAAASSFSSHSFCYLGNCHQIRDWPTRTEGEKVLFTSTTIPMRPFCFTVPLHVFLPHFRTLFIFIQTTTTTKPTLLALVVQTSGAFFCIFRAQRMRGGLRLNFRPIFLNRGAVGGAI